MHKQVFVFLLLSQFAVHLAPTFHNFVAFFPHSLSCVLCLQELRKKNEALLPNEKEKSQTLARALFLSSNAYNESNYLSLHHGSKGRKTQVFIATTCNLHHTQALSTHSLTSLDLQECQAKEEVPHIGTSFHPSIQRDSSK